MWKELFIVRLGLFLKIKSVFSADIHQLFVRSAFYDSP